MPIVGDVLAGRYRVLGPLGAGGMASVWRARDLRLGRDVAVKVLLPNLSADPATATRFDREARSLAAAGHPNVVSVFDVEPGDPGSGREPFYVMELCEGGSLADRLAVAVRLPPDAVAAVITAVADGLTDLHRRGMVHRDVKPHNILFCDAAGTRPKLGDFGLARSEEDGLDSLTATGTTIGTLAYLAPELLAGETATPASDVYALGVVAFQALTGRLPRPAGSVMQVVEGRSAPAALASVAAPDLGTVFDAALAPALSADPTDRPSPVDLAAGLAAAARATETAPDSPTQVVPIAAAGAPVAAEAVAARPVAAPEPVGATGRPARDAPRPGPPGARASRERARARPALGAVVAAVLIIAALAALSGVLGGDDRGAGSSRAPAGASESAATTPAPPDADVAKALERLAEVYTQTAAAREEGLEDETADELDRRARAVEDALRAGDLELARERADRLLSLADDVRRIGRGGDDDDGEPHPVGRAAERVKDAIPGD